MDKTLPARSVLAISILLSPILLLLYGSIITEMAVERSVASASSHAVFTVVELRTRGNRQRGIIVRSCCPQQSFFLNEWRHLRKLGCACPDANIHDSSPLSVVVADSVLGYTGLTVEDEDVLTLFTCTCSGHGGRTDIISFLNVPADRPYRNGR